MSELQEREPFEITNDRTADWAIRKIQAAERELDRMKAWYDRQLEAAKKERDDEVAYFTGLLMRYFAQVPAKDTKTMKKYALPSGEMVLNKAKDDFAVADPEALVSWCQSNDPELVRVKTEPAWAAIKKRLVQSEAGIVDKETGVVVDGVELVNKPEEFKIRLKEAEQDGDSSYDPR